MSTKTESSTESSSGLDVAVEEREAWKRRLTIKVAPERVARVRRRELQKLRKNVRLKGFRKGKVPERVIEERFGPAVEERTVRALIDEAFRQALDVESLQPLGDPSFGDVQYDPGKSLTFQVEFEIMPEVRLERVGGFRLERPDVDVSDREVDEMLQRLRNERAVWQPADRKPEEGDLVSVRIARLGEATGGEGEREDGEGEVEGAAGEPAEAASEPAEARPYRFELGEGYAIPGVEEAILTLSPGEKGEFDVTFPEDFDDQEMAGATRRLRIELVDVKEKRLPDLDDQFAQDVGDFESLAALRDAILEDLRRHGEEEVEDAMRRRLIDNIVDANPFEVPAAMVERYLDQVIDAPEEADPEQIQSARRELRPTVERQIKHQFLLDTLIEREGFEATEEEVEARIDEIAERRGVTTAEARKRLGRQKGMDEVRRRIAVEKVFDWLLSQSTVD